MTKWIGIENASDKYKVAGKRICQWCQRREIASSEIEGYLMIDEDSLLSRLELKKQEQIARAELDNKSAEIINGCKEDLFILSSMKELTEIMKALIMELGDLLDNDSKRKLFLHLALKGSIEEYATENNMTIEMTQNLFNFVIRDIKQRAGFIKNYKEERILLKAKLRTFEIGQNTIPRKIISTPVQNEAPPLIKQVKTIPDEIKKVLSTPVLDMGFDTRTKNCLALLEIITLEDLLVYTKKYGFDKLLTIKHMGVGSYNKLMNILRVNNILDAKDECRLYIYLSD